MAMRNKGGIPSTCRTNVVEGDEEEKDCDCLGMEASKSPMGQATLQTSQLKKDGPSAELEAIRVLQDT